MTRPTPAPADEETFYHDAQGLKRCKACHQIINGMSRCVDCRPAPAEGARERRVEIRPGVVLRLPPGVCEHCFCFIDDGSCVGCGRAIPAPPAEDESDPEPDDLCPDCGKMLTVRVRVERTCCTAPDPEAARLEEPTYSRCPCCETNIVIEATNPPQLRKLRLREMDAAARLIRTLGAPGEAPAGERESPHVGSIEWPLNRAARTEGEG